MSDLSPLFAPRGVVVIGASRDGGKLGAVMARTLAGFDGPLGLVNTRSPDPATGVFASVGAAVEAIQAPLDLAVLCVPAAVCAAALEEAADHGVQAALVCAGGFAEAGDDGEAHQNALLDVARSRGVRLLGPNTSGFLAPARSLTASFVPGVSHVDSGGVAVVAASGGINHAIAFLLAEAGLGVSLAVGLGNAIDVSTPDVLDHIAQDGRTRAVALHVESVADGARLRESVRALTAHVPVAALVVGQNDVAEFAQSHTGALATSWRTTRAVLRQAGAVLVDDEHELVDAVSALAHARLPASPDAGVGVVTAQAGPGLVLLDALRGRGVRVPSLQESTLERLATLLPPITFQRNPVDTGRPSAEFSDVISVVAQDPQVDLVAVYALTEPGNIDLGSVAAQVRAEGSAPALLAAGGPPAEVRALQSVLHEGGSAGYVSPTGLARGVGALVEDARLRGLADRDSVSRGLPDNLDGMDRRAWDEDEAKQLMERCGFRTMPRRACESAEQAHAALEEWQSPVAVKILDGAILHKTEIGGVHLGVAGHDHLDRALDALRGVGATRFLVEQMAPAGVDLIVGARRDPVFGPMVLLGMGGVMAEAVADVSLRAAPLSTAQAASMPDDLRAAALLDGWRGGPVLDRGELAALLRALGDLLVRAPHIEEVEVNPLRLTASGLIGLDAVITTKEA